MKTIERLTLIILVLCTTIDSKGQEATPSHKDSLNQVIRRYYALNLKVYSKNSTRNDIDRLFELFSEDFVYIHSKYGGAYTRRDLYDGYISNQQNGGYDGSTVDVKITNSITGLNGAATERVYYRKEEDGTLNEIDPGMTLFEFENGRISKIIEYW